MKNNYGMGVRIADRSQGGGGDTNRQMPNEDVIKLNSCFEQAQNTSFTLVHGRYNTAPNKLCLPQAPWYALPDGRLSPAARPRLASHITQALYAAQIRVSLQDPPSLPSLRLCVVYTSLKIRCNAAPRISGVQL